MISLLTHSLWARAPIQLPRSEFADVAEAALWADDALMVRLCTVRDDAVFAIPALYCVQEEESFQYTIRIPANKVPMARISHLFTRPVRRPPHKPKVFHKSFSYQAQSWDHPCRVVAKVGWHFDELFPAIYPEWFRALALDMGGRYDVLFTF